MQVNTYRQRHDGRMALRPRANRRELITLDGQGQVVRLEAIPNRKLRRDWAKSGEDPDIIGRLLLGFAKELDNKEVIAELQEIIDVPWEKRDV